jgi:TolB-like protein
MNRMPSSKSGRIGCVSMEEMRGIAAWLIETSGETQVWTGVYDRCLTDALSVQTDVASLIAGSLASELRPQ